MRKALILLLMVLIVFTMAVSGCTEPGEGAITTSGEASDAITEIGEGVGDVGEILEDIDRKLS